MRTMLGSVIVAVSLALVAPIGDAAPPAGEGSTAAPVTSEPTTSVAVGAEQPGEPLDFGLAPLPLIAPAVTEAGQRPTFTWEPVAGAAAYTLAVVTDTGEPLWAWQGPETTVIIGGWPETPPPEAPGPLLLGPSSWFVMALDGDGRPIANSVLRPVAP